MQDALQLGAAEQFALWSLRHRRARPWDGYTLAEGQRRAFGLARLEEVMAALAALDETLRRHGRRRLSLNGCACRAVAADEQALLALLAAAQAGDRAHLSALTLWLCCPDGQAALADAAARLAAAFLSRGLRLPRRAPPPPRACASGPFLGRMPYG